jgi:hypothetical protein
MEGGAKIRHTGEGRRADYAYNLGEADELVIGDGHDVGARLLGDDSGCVLVGAQAL